MLKSLTNNNIYNVKWKNIDDQRTIYSASLVKNNQSYIVNPNNISINNNVNTFDDRKILLNNKKIGILYPKHRPLNLYRKQYNIYSKNSNISVKNIFDKPGISTLKYDNNKSICDIENNVFNDNIINSSQITFDNEKTFYNESLNKIICLSCLPENNIIKSGSTIINKNYSTTMQQHLYKKRKTYEQNLGKKYLVCQDELCETDKPIYKTGSIIKSNNNNVNNTNCTNINNYPSVSASSRIARVKYDTIQQYKKNTSNYQQQKKNLTNPSNNCRQNGLMFKPNVILNNNYCN